MTYDEMLQGLAAAGHDVSHVKRPDVVTKAAPVAPAPLSSTVVAIDIDEIATALDRAIGDEIEPLRARIDELEARVAALESELQKFMKPGLRSIG